MIQVVSKTGIKALLFVMLSASAPAVSNANTVSLGNAYYQHMTTKHLLKITDNLLSENRIREANKILSLLAKRPDDESQFEVARLRARRLDSLRDTKMAVRTFSSFIEGTSPLRGRAAFELARLYRTDDALGKQKLVLDTLLLAAQLGNTKAYAEIAFVHASGIGTPKNYSKALEYYEAAAKFQSAAPIVAFARFLRRSNDNGDAGVNPKAIVAKHYPKLLKEATGGYAAAAKELARLHVDGELKPRSYIKARKWLRQAVAGGDIGALRDLALLEISANDNERTVKRSLAMLKEAADAGNRAALQALEQLEEEIRARKEN